MTSQQSCQRGMHSHADHPARDPQRPSSARIRQEASLQPESARAVIQPQDRQRPDPPRERHPARIRAEPVISQDPPMSHSANQIRPASRHRAPILSPGAARPSVRSWPSSVGAAVLQVVVVCGFSMTFCDLRGTSVRLSVVSLSLFLLSVKLLYRGFADLDCIDGAASSYQGCHVRFAVSPVSSLFERSCGFLSLCLLFTSRLLSVVMLCVVFLNSVSSHLSRLYVVSMSPVSTSSQVVMWFPDVCAPSSSSGCCMCFLYLCLLFRLYVQSSRRVWREPCNQVVLDPEFMVTDAATAVYHAIYNGEWEMGKEALEDILYRAQLELYSQPLLVRPNPWAYKLSPYWTTLPDRRRECQEASFMRDEFDANLQVAISRSCAFNSAHCFDYTNEAELSVTITPSHTSWDPAANRERGGRGYNIIPPITLEYADGMSVGEESFNLNDPDEGFSSGASNSSQPSATKPGGPGPRGGSQKSSSVKKTVTARLSRERERELMHREKEMEKMKDQERVREKERELERWREKERQRERVAESRRELFSAVVATPTAALRRRQQTQTPSPAPPPVTMDTIDIELSPIKKQQSFPGPCPSPSPGTLVRTASSTSSKSLYEGVNMNLNGSISSLGGALGGSGGLEGALGGLAASVGGGGTHRYSTISLQEEVLARPEENQELLSSGAPLTKQSRSPSFNMQIISQV
ncbi:LOW QUALITY PROTEIN: uncharacterized protein [Salvelinus sp. IW2-2015]|uniref:LOW QUALITY PROTEIN: uncharacterized protein n=1 Tax=Salvelinus sp. IW2-2015 TaxID=2691554 RepID=UPI0038D3718E